MQECFPSVCREVNIRKAIEYDNRGIIDTPFVSLNVNCVQGGPTTLKVTLFNATITKDADPYWGQGRSDPYVYMRDPEGHTYAWSTKNDNHSPVWNEEKTVHTALKEDSTLLFEVWDF